MKLNTSSGSFCQYVFNIKCAGKDGSLTVIYFFFKTVEEGKCRSDQFYSAVVSVVPCIERELYAI